jgi:hypothetical protein
MNVVERKNRLLQYLARRGEPVALDHLALTPPRVARFIASLSEGIPVWIACRSDAPRVIGRVWEYLYNFVRVEVPPLTPHEAQLLIEHAVAIGSIQPEAKAHANHLCRLIKQGHSAHSRRAAHRVGRKEIRDGQAVCLASSRY